MADLVVAQDMIAFTAVGLVAPHYSLQVLVVDLVIMAAPAAAVEVVAELGQQPRDLLPVTGITQM